MKPEIREIYTEYSADLSSLYDELVGAVDEDDRDEKRMDLETYLNGFGVASGLVPSVLDSNDLEMIFDTIINERNEITTEQSALSQE